MMKTYTNSRYWSDQQKELLRQHWSTHNPQEIAELLGRSLRSVQQTANRLGLPPAVKTLRNSRYWTIEEKQLLRHHWPTMSLPQIAKLLERSLRSVKLTAQQLGLPSKDSQKPAEPGLNQPDTFYDPRPWTPEEEKIFRSMYLAGENLDVISRSLQRSVPALNHQRNKMTGMSRKPSDNWSADQDEHLRKHWATQSVGQIALGLGMFNDRVARRAKALGLTDQTDLLRKDYTAEEIDYLRANYPRLKAKALAANLNRSVISVQNKLQQLKRSPVLVVPRKRTIHNKPEYYWRAEDDAYLKANYRQKTNQQLATGLGRTQRSVIHRLQHLHLKRDKNLIFQTIDQIPDSYATSLISKNVNVRNLLLKQPQLLTLRKAKLILDKRIRDANS